LIVVLYFFVFRTICLYGIQYRIGPDKDYSDAGYIYGLYFKNTRSDILRCTVNTVYKVMLITETRVYTFNNFVFLIIMFKKTIDSQRFWRKEGVGESAAVATGKV